MFYKVLEHEVTCVALHMQNMSTDTFCLFFVYIYIYKFKFQK